MITSSAFGTVLGSTLQIGDEPVEMWAVSRKLDRGDAVKIDEFWEASPVAAQER